MLYDAGIEGRLLKEFESKDLKNKNKKLKNVKQHIGSILSYYESGPWFYSHPGNYLETISSPLSDNRQQSLFL